MPVVAGRQANPDQLLSLSTDQQKLEAPVRISVVAGVSLWRNKAKFFPG